MICMSIVLGFVFDFPFNKNYLRYLSNAHMQLRCCYKFETVLDCLPLLPVIASQYLFDQNFTVIIVISVL